MQNLKQTLQMGRRLNEENELDIDDRWEPCPDTKGRVRGEGGEEDNMCVCQDTEECSAPSHWVGPRLESPRDDLCGWACDRPFRKLRGNCALETGEDLTLGGGSSPPRGTQGHPTLISGMQGDFVHLFSLLVASQMPRKEPGS